MKSTEEIIKEQRGKSIAEIIKEISGKYAPQSIYSDWVEMMALSIENSTCLFKDEIWRKREQRYKDICQKYTKEEVMKLCFCTSLLVNSLEEELKDELGKIYMELDASSSRTGQFFTPFHLSVLMAKLMKPNDDDELSINEPSCGGGGMIIAMVKELSEEKRRKVKVLAQDLDYRCVHMCYVQLSLIGVDAVVAQGNTLTSEYTLKRAENIFETPKRKGVLL